MCGILGHLSNSDTHVSLDTFEQCLSLLTHRGPNQLKSISFQNERSTLYLGHTRLSILDLSERGTQPMTSPCGRYTLTYNGEIYNFKEIRENLEKKGHTFNSNTDTEVLLYAWIEWGYTCLETLHGMFAFAIYDSHLKTITCVRDAFGIKPFFYSNINNAFIFSSEIRPLIKLHPSPPQLNEQACYNFLVFNEAETGSDTFLQQIQQLKPGHMIEIKCETQAISQQKKWVNLSTETNPISFEEATTKLRELFLTSVRYHLRSDVAVGAAISGGIDSSAIVCAIRHLEPTIDIHTFSYIAQGEKSEETWVDYINQHIDAIPHKTAPSEETLFNDLMPLIKCQGQPATTTSCYAQFKVFELAKKHNIVVTLDGQGADELLAGYRGYAEYRLLSLLKERSFKKAVTFLKNWGTWPGRSISTTIKKTIGFFLPDFIYKRFYFYEKYKTIFPSWINHHHFRKKGIKCTPNRYRINLKEKKQVTAKLLGELTSNGLPLLLRYADRNAMYHSIESRVPFLTLPLAQFLLSLPEDYLINDHGETKHIFREAMKGIVPEKVLSRKDKVGFETPQNNWLKKESSQIKDILQKQPFSFLKTPEMMDYYNRFLRGNHHDSNTIWRWISFIVWHAHIFERPLTGELLSPEPTLKDRV